MTKIMFKYTDKAKLFIYIFFRLVQNIVFVYVPINSARFIDSIVAKNYVNSIKYGKLEILILIIYTSLFIINQYLESLIDIDIFEGFIRSLRRKVQLLKREDEPDSQNFNLILNQNFEIIKPFFVSVPLRIIFSILSIIMIVITMFTLNFQMGVVIIVSVIVGLFLSVNSGKVLYKYEDIVMDKNNIIKDYTYDSYALRYQENDVSQIVDFDNEISDYKKERKKKELISAFIENIFLYGMLNVIVVIVTLFSGYQVFLGNITVGIMSAFSVYVSQLWTPMEDIVNTVRDYIGSRPAINAFINFMDKNEMEINDEKINKLEIKDYVPLDKENNKLTHEVDYLFTNGHYVICGENGSGKTTLVESILGINSRYCGDIFVNDKINTGYLADSTYIFGNSYIAKHGLLKSFINGSYGEKKTASVNFYINTEKNLLIIDEPTNFLDGANKENIINSILNIKDKIVIVVSNDDAIKNDARFNRVDLKKLD